MTLKPIDPPENWKELLSHEYANYFPLIPLDQLRETLPSMWVDGYDETEPVVLFEDRVLDGRNRLRAAIESNRVPAFAVLIGTRFEAEGYSVRKNLNRRQMTEEQKLSVGLKLEGYFARKLKERQVEGARKGAETSNTKRLGRLEEIPPQGDDPAPKTRAPQARDLAAEALNLSGRSLGEFKRLKRDFPDLAEKVERGEMKLWAAVAETRPSLKARRKKTPTQPANTPEPDVPVATNETQEPIATEEPPEWFPTWRSDPKRFSEIGCERPKKVTLHCEVQDAARKVRQLFDRERIVAFIWNLAGQLTDQELEDCIGMMRHVQTKGQKA